MISHATLFAMARYMCSLKHLLYLPFHSQALLGYLTFEEPIT